MHEKIALKFKFNLSSMGNAFKIRIWNNRSRFSPILTNFVQFRPILAKKIAWKIALKFKLNLSSMGNVFKIRIWTNWSYFGPILTNFVQFRPILVLKIAWKIALNFKLNLSSMGNAFKIRIFGQIGVILDLLWLSLSNFKFSTFCPFYKV